MSRLHPTAATIPLRVLAAALLLGILPFLARAQGAAVQAPPQFAKTCALCHGNDAAGTDRAPALAGVAALRSMPDADIAAIISKGKGRMPAFPLPAADIDALTRYIRNLNTSAMDVKVIGDPKAGERLFFGDAHCSVCHMALGQGTAFGPDLSTVGRRMKLSDLHQALVDPDISITPGYGQVMVTLKNGSKLHGFARAQGSHDLVLQTGDGKLHLLTEADYRSLVADKTPAMPPFYGKADQQNDLIAYLSTLNGIGVGPLAGESAAAQIPVIPEEIDQVVHPKTGSWPTYNGTVDGNRNSRLTQVNLTNAARLQLQWSYTIPYFGLETTPVVVDGVMFVTGNNQVYAISGRTGREIWRYERPKSPAATISGDAAIGVNRGVAVLGDRVFYLTDDAHLIALHRLTGALLWDVATPETGAKGFYGGTAAPLVVGDLVITGVSGGDQGIRGFVAAYKATTGEQVWKLYTIPQPGDTGPIADTWKGTALEEGGGATWTTGSADVAAGIVYWPAGNPHPDTDGDRRLGVNLYTNSDLAIDLKTGKLLWYFQYTPHDLHDWDANQPIVLVDTIWKGKPRKLLLHANRNGFLYVLDRTNGKLLLVSRMVDTLNWASSIDPQTGVPNLLPANETTEKGTVGCPAVRGATNWYSTAYSPATRLYYVMTVEDCTIYRKADDGGYGRYLDPAHPAQKILRAFNIETGKAAWQIALPGPVQSNYSGVLSTAGGLLFFGESSGGFAAVDARTGRYIWHFETNHAIKASPMTYSIGGRQYVAIASGPNILSFALPQ